MSDGSLSQDEIDALLQGTDDVDTLSGGFSNQPEMGSQGGMQSDNSAFLELMNSVSGNMGGALSALVGKAVTISNPRVETIGLQDLYNQLNNEVIEIKMDFQSGVVGEHSYVLDVDTGLNIANLMMGQEGGELTEASLSAVSEAVNTLCGNSMNTIGSTVKKELRTAPPESDKKVKTSIKFSPQEPFVKVTYDLLIEGAAPSQLIELYAMSAVKEINQELSPATNEMAGVSSGQQKGQNMMNQSMGNMGMQQNMMGNMGMPQNMMGNMGVPPYMMNQMGMPQNMNNMNMGSMMPPSQVQNVQFGNFNGLGTDSQQSNINLLMDVNMELTVELGRTKKSIKDILGMGEGTVIELDKLAGEPVDILVNGKLIARGEVVVIDENFGVRVTEIISPMDRIRDFG